MDSYIFRELLLILSIILTFGAQIMVSVRYKKYSKVRNAQGMSGAEAAHRILKENGLSNINVVEINGYLSDHYDPKGKVIRLSSANYQGNSIAAVAIAAHECGHAIQDKEGYSFLRLRSKMFPLVKISSYAGYIAILLGCLFGALNLVLLGILFEIVILFFQVVTLPVEFNASSRALVQIEKLGLLVNDELNSGKKVLTAAAMTYVASVATTLVQVLRLLSIFSDRRR